MDRNHPYEFHLFHHNYQLLTPDGQGQVNGAKVNDGQRPEERKNNLNFMDFKVLQ